MGDDALHAPPLERKNIYFNTGQEIPPPRGDICGGIIVL
jgi:hypothetical protein